MLEPIKKIPDSKILHELNNQGCLCEMCQKLTRRENMEIKLQKIVDKDSEEFNPHKTKEFFIPIIRQLIKWDKKPRKLRYLLPQICLYSKTVPVQRIAKRKQSGGLVWIHDKAKMHMFEIIHFFLQGFIHHKNLQPKIKMQPILNKAKKNKSDAINQQQQKVIGIYSQKYKNQCIAVGKYKNNNFNMFTLGQMESLFKSRYRHLREGLLYLQTIIHSEKNIEYRINIDVRKFIGEQIYERAKNQVRMILQEIKPSDMDFIPQEEQIIFQQELKQKNIRQYLEYFTLKIILMHSRNKQSIISKAVFKYMAHRNYQYIWDIRVDKTENSDQFWAAGMMKAFQYRLHKRMSMMDMNKQNNEEERDQQKLNIRTKNLKNFLQNSVSAQWSEMGLIKNRLQKLQKEKKSLMQSQSFAEGDNRSMFKIRNIKR